jgi:MoaA/NifB/PqqE/SkfB family radical SAM enzyme
MVDFMIKEKTKRTVKYIDKVFLNYRISRWHAQRSAPASIIMDVSGACNLNCTMCSLKEWFPKSEPKMMSPEIVDKIVSYVKNIKHITLQCNCEPLINPDVHLIIQSLKKENPSIVVSLVTNGTLLSMERSQQLIQGGVDEIAISIDGATKESYERVRKGANFEKVMENISNFNRLRERDGKKRLKLGIITVLTRNNLDELYDICKLAIALHADGFYVNGLEAYSEEQYPAVVYGSTIDRNARKIFNKVRSLSRKNHIALSLPELKLRGRSTCLLTGFVIDTQGNVFPCGALSYERPFFRDHTRFVHPRICMGNVMEQPIQHIVSSPDFVKFRKELLRGKLPHYCRECLIKDKVICI